ncbi:cell adhesion molecule Dscam2-like [Uloborus diversus]|uniref:cell adhesion molecule Dscam2-like n=1 Tax=Uloborus diversus TaxID=327109 RepID=UPI002409F4F0|nr:cell adhesion molecule Dscam2-like [Uloborus diversus]
MPSKMLENLILLLFITTLTKAGESPAVTPFMFPPLKEGERASAICTIKSGDRPLKFQWKKDGRDIAEIPKVDIQSVKDASSILTIESVSSKFSGNYTCTISNSFGSDSFTASLVVSAPPQWVQEPFDAFSKEGESLRIDCRATGVPLPTVTWTAGDKTESFTSTEQSSTIRVSPSGTLIIDKIEAAMKGSYTCTADNAFDSPAVAPFIFPPALKEGDRASVTCTITSGDRPLQFQWKKDGQDISSFKNIKTQSITDTSILIIESVTAKSSGNYSCIISNSHGSDTFTAVLTVTAPPEWIKEPEDKFTQEGDSLTIECEASGVPKPNVKWTSGADSAYQISTDQISTMRVTQTGSLIIGKVDSSMKGSYTCEAENGFGKSLRKTISISVRESPAVTPFIFPPLKEGERASATCTIKSGDRPLQFQWKKDGRDISEISKVEIQTVKDASSILTIESVSSKFSGNYTCIISNSYGSDSFTAALIVSAPPEWVQEPFDAFSKEGESLRIDCRATGVPTPSVTWTASKY